MNTILNRKRFTSSRMLSSLLLAAAIAVTPLSASATGKYNTSSKTPMMAGGSQMMGGGQTMGGGRMTRHLEVLGDELDLTATQMEKIQKIMKTAKGARQQHHAQGLAMHQAIMKLNPMGANYLQKVDAQANKMADRMKQKIKAMALVRKQVYGVLNKEQREKLTRMTGRRMFEMQMQGHARGMGMMGMGRGMNEGR